MPNWNNVQLTYRVEYFLDTEATRHKPQRCYVLPKTFGTDLEASTAARRAFPRVRKQFGRVCAHVVINELCPAAIGGV